MSSIPQRQSTAQLQGSEGKTTQAGATQPGLAQKLSPQSVMKNVTDLWGGGATRGKPVNPAISSEVIKNAEDMADIILLLEHEGIRQEIKKLRAVLPQISTATDWKVRLFLSWFTQFYTAYSKSHLEGEEDVLFPQVSTQAQIPDTIMEQHHTLSQKFDDICDLSEQFALAASRQEKHVIVGKLVTMVNDVTHLQEQNMMEEEEHLTPLVRKFMTGGQIAKTLNRNFSEAGVWQSRIDLPPTFTAAKKWMTPTQYRDLVNRLPFFQYYALDLLKKNWEERTDNMLKAIQQDTPPNECSCTY